METSFRSPPRPGCERYAVGEMALEGWRIDAHPEWVAIVVDALDDAQVALRPGESGTPRELAVQRLRVIGDRLTGARSAWARAVFARSPADATVAAMWQRWGRGSPFEDQAAWLRLIERPVTTAFRQALLGRPLPENVVARAIGDLRDALFYQLIGGRNASGFAEVATHVLETAPGGPVGPLFAVLSPRSRSLVATCVSRRGHWPRTLATALSAAGPRERALLLQTQQTQTADEWIELHTALRLIASWSSDTGDADRDWAIVQQNRGRSRGRLRAVAATEPPQHLARTVAALTAVAERTNAAARRWAWSWAWEALARGFSFDLDQSVIRPCLMQGTRQPLCAEEVEVLECWLLLVVLRGKGDTARRWCREGSGDSDGTWGRLLRELPADLRDADGGFVRVRAALAQRWTEHVVVLRPILAKIAALPGSRKLKSAFWEQVGPVWHEAIGRPRAGFPTFVRHAAAWSTRQSVHGSETEGPMPTGGTGR